MKIKTRSNKALMFCGFIFIIPFLPEIIDDIKAGALEEPAYIIGAIIIFALMVGYTLVLFAFSKKNFYVLEDEELRYDLWGPKSTLKYSEIAKIRVSYIPANFYSLTARRIYIFDIYSNDYSFSLPAKEDQELFISEITKRCPNAKIDFSKLKS